MKPLALFALIAFALAPILSAQLRVHRIDKLGAHAPSSPRFDHTEARAEAEIVFAALAKQQGWDFTQSSESELFTDEGLEPVDVIIFDNNTGILFDEAEKRAFEKWVQAGGGVVGIHGALHAHKGVDHSNEAEWPFWYELWGVLHDTGPKEGPQGRRGYPDWIVMENAADKRWTQNVPMKWRLEKVEWYFWKYHRSFSEMQVIASAEVRENQPQLPDYYPVTWKHEYKGGRVWYTNMGHYAENFHQKEFVQHILDGIAWTADDKRAASN